MIVVIIICLKLKIQQQKKEREEKVEYCDDCFDIQYKQSVICIIIIICATRASF